MEKVACHLSLTNFRGVEGHEGEGFEGVEAPKLSTLVVF